MGSILDLAKRDTQKIIQGGFGVDINLSTPDGLTSIDLVGLGTKHSIGLDLEGRMVSTKNAHVTLPESVLITESYPYRIDNEVNLEGHKVSFKDSTDLVKTYVIREWFPDETVGCIMCILNDFVE